MRDVKQVMDELREHGYHKQWYVRKEYQWLAENVRDSEAILAAIRGLWHGNNTVLIVLTSQRLIFVDCGMIYGTRLSVVQLKVFNEFSHTSGLWACGISAITSSGSVLEAHGVWVSLASQFSQSIDQAVDQMTQQSQASSLAPSSGDGLGIASQSATTSSTADELLKLHQLLADKIITQDEYTELKQKLLNS